MSPWVSIRFLQTQSDERLLAAARQGHERAFEALVRRHRAALLGHALRLLPDVSAEDALQQGLLQAWTALQRGAEVHVPRAWLHRVVHNAAVDVLRSRSHVDDDLAAWAAATDAPNCEGEELAALRETLSAMAALPAIQREALLRTAVEGDSHERVASALGLSAGAVRGLVYRARVTLRAAASALTPPPIAAIAARLVRRAAPAGHPFANLIAGGQESDITGVLLSGGAAALSTGVLAVAAVPLARHMIHAHGTRPTIASGRHDADPGRTQAPPLTSEASGRSVQASRPMRSPLRGVGTGDMKFNVLAGLRAGSLLARGDAGAEINADRHDGSFAAEQGRAGGRRDDGRAVAGAEIADTRGAGDGGYDSNTVSGSDTSRDGGGSGSSPGSGGGSGAGTEGASDGGSGSGGSDGFATDGSSASGGDLSGQGTDGGGSGGSGDGPSSAQGTDGGGSGGSGGRPSATTSELGSADAGQPA